MKDKIIKISTIVLVVIIIGISGFVFAETYKIKSGDTFSKVARDYGLTIKELKRLNPQIKNINKIFAGKFLKIKEFTGGGFLEPQENPILGAATQPVAGATYTLSGSGVSSSATSLTLTSFTIPQTGYEILDGDLSSTFYLTLEPGSRTRQEIISCTTVAQSGSDTTATISGCTRGLLPFYPYTASTTYQFSHGGGTSVVFSNPPQLYEEFANRFNTSTITGIWTFASSSLPRASSTPTYGAGDELKFATYGQVASTSYAGTVPMSSTVAGLVMGATQPQMASGTPTGVSAGTTYQLVPHNKYFNSTSTATTTAVVTGGTGKIHSGFIATSSDYIWSGNTTSTGITVISGTTTLSGSTTISGTITASATTTITANLLAQGSVNTLATTTHSGTQTFNSGITFAATSTNYTYTRAVLWQFLGSNNLAASWTQPTGATAAIVNYRTKQNNCAADPVFGTELVVFSTGKTIASARGAGCATGNYEDISLSWSGTTLTVSTSSDGTLQNETGTVYWFK